MRLGVLGTGMVGVTIGTKLVELGNEVRLGSRFATNERVAAWVARAGARASQGTFADAAAFAEELVFNCTAGVASLDALRSAGADALRVKILIDVANPIVSGDGSGRLLSVCNDDSLGESIQRAFPDTRVVKTLNTMNCRVMVDPARVPGEHDVFLCGDDAAAKEAVTVLLTEGFGWPRVIDLGDLRAARALEMYLPLWLRLYGRFGTADVNVGVRAAAPAAQRGGS